MQGSQPVSVQYGRCEHQNPHNRCNRHPTIFPNHSRKILVFTENDMIKYD
jgi:hypothetical protein